MGIDAHKDNQKLINIAKKNVTFLATLLETLKAFSK